MFEQAVSECVNAAQIDTSTPSSCLQSLNEKKRELVKKVQLKLNAVPKKMSTKIGFSSLHEQTEKEEGEEQDEDEQ
jgi:hypothetical protein